MAKRTITTKVNGELQVNGEQLFAQRLPNEPAALMLESLHNDVSGYDSRCCYCYHQVHHTHAVHELMTQA